MSRQLRVQRTPRRRSRRVDLSPLTATTYAPDTSSADELLDRIARVLELV